MADLDHESELRFWLRVTGVLALFGLAVTLEIAGAWWRDMMGLPQ